MTLPVDDGVPAWVAALDTIGRFLVKDAADPSGPEPAYDLGGMLQHSGGRIILSVPNGLAHAIVGDMVEPGVELPPGDDGGKFNAAVVVMSEEDLDAIGGADHVDERGKQFRYTIGRLYAEDVTWPGISRVWYLRVHSPELQTLRRSHGLPSLPPDSNDFHVVVAVRRRGVLARNEKSKN